MFVLLVSRFSVPIYQWNQIERSGFRTTPHTTQNLQHPPSDRRKSCIRLKLRKDSVVLRLFLSRYHICSNTLPCDGIIEYSALLSGENPIPLAR
jgi:hypothetical protein